MKKFKLIIVILIFFSTSIFANMPVIDIPHILESIHNGYQIYQQVQNTIQQLQYQYEQTKAQIQQLQSFDFSSIDSFSDAVGFVDENLSFLRNTENSLKNMRVTIGNNSYDLLSLYKIPGGVFDEMTDLWTREMTEEEKAKAWSRYGLDPRSYVYTQVWKDRITKGSKQLAVLAENVEERIEKNGSEVEEIVKKSKNTESIVGLLQALIALYEKLYQEISIMSATVSTTGNLIADQAMANEYIPPETQISDAFFEKSNFDPESLKFKGDRD